MTYEFCIKLIEKGYGRTSWFVGRIDVLYMLGRLTTEEYLDLIEKLGVITIND